MSLLAGTRRVLLGQARIIDVIPEGPLHLWKLGEDGAVDREDSVGSITLTQHGSPSSTGGAFGGSTAIQFDQTDDWLEASDHDDLSPANRDWTIAFWLKWTADGVVLNKEGAGGDEFQMYTTLGVVEMIWRKADNSGWITTTAASALSSGVWTPIRAWHDATADTVNLQIGDAAVVSQAIPDGGVRTGTSGFGVGSQFGFGSFILAAMDALVIYDRILSDAEWTAYRAGTEAV